MWKLIFNGTSKKKNWWFLVNQLHYYCLWTFVKINDIVSVSVAFEHFKIHLITQKFPIKCLKIFYKILYTFISGVTILYTLKKLIYCFFSWWREELKDILTQVLYFFLHLYYYYNSIWSFKTMVLYIVQSFLDLCPFISYFKSYYFKDKGSCNFKPKISILWDPNFLAAPTLQIQGLLLLLTFHQNVHF